MQQFMRCAWVAICACFMLSLPLTATLVGHKFYTCVGVFFCVASSDFFDSCSGSVAGMIALWVFSG